MSGPELPTVGFCKQYVDAQTDPVPTLQLGQDGASLLNALKFRDAPHTPTGDTPPQRYARKQTQEEEESEAEETMVAETKRQLEDFLNSVERDTEATFLDKSGKDAIHGHDKRKLGSMKRGLLRGWCPDVCVGHAAGMLATQTASYQYESLLVTFSFEGTANQLRGKIDTAVEGAIKRAQKQAGRSQCTLSEILTEYEMEQHAILQFAEDRSEKLDTRKIETAHYTVMQSFGRHSSNSAGVPNISAGSSPARAEFCGTVL
ncbi:TPA: hypothetical protein ACH3X1_000251 [Trebouxia sp. C0004]